MTQIILWYLKTRFKIRWWVFTFIKRAKIYPFRVTVHLLFSFLLQMTLKSVFLPRYESLKLNLDTNYLMTSEDMVEDPLMSVQFYIKSKNFSISCYSPFLFSFLLWKTLKSVFLPRYESLKINHETNYLMTSEDTVQDTLMGVQFYIKSKSFFNSCYNTSTVFNFIAEDAKFCISTTL